MKTIKEVAKEYAEKSIDQSYHASVKLAREYAQIDFKAGVEFAQHWIDVNEELPKENTPVIVKLDYKFFGTDIQATDVCKLFAGDWINCLRSQHSNGGVTHWRRIELK